MHVDPAAALFAGLLLGVVAVSHLRDRDRQQYDADRKAWEQERLALLQRLVPGVPLLPVEPVKRKPWTDEREAELERERSEQ
jgi:hypothetical protein